jgi:hypothetical protein
MGFGHLYVDAEAAAVAGGIDRHLAARGFRRVTMAPDLHPRRMKQIHETRQRLFWLSPRCGRWTGIFEFRYYDNEDRERWGYTDESLAVWLSVHVGETWRLEVADNAGFWMYARYVKGKEEAGRAYQDTPADRSADPAHPRYELNRIIEREGFKNVGLGYENVPGPQVCPIENVPQSPHGIEGLEGFTHLAFEAAPK